jgi:hypothetical protein
MKWNSNNIIDFLKMYENNIDITTTPARTTASDILKVATTTSYYLLVASTLAILLAMSITQSDFTRQRLK